MHPFVALMRTYCIDYTNSHDQSLYEQIMEPDYVLHTMGFTLSGRDKAYSPAVTQVFAEYPSPGSSCTSSSSMATGCACGSASTAPPSSTVPA
jgi:hypothetical protein